MTATTTTTPGRAFFDEQIGYISTGRIDELIENHYTEDALLITPFDLLDSPPPHLIRGQQALKDFFRTYLGWHGALNVEALYNFAETDNAISFHAIFTSQTGRWFVGDGWHLRDGKIDIHYSYAYKLE